MARQQVPRTCRYSRLRFVDHDFDLIGGGAFHGSCETARFE